MLTLDPNATALVIVDLQQGILALPLMPHDADHVVARSVELGRALAEAGGVLVLVNVDYSDRYADRPTGLVDAPLNLPAEGLPEGWARLAPEVAALPAQVRITKRQHSAFFGTELDLQLRRRGIGTVMICGLATNFGVEATARDAHALNYAVVIASDACSSTSPPLHDFALTHILPRVARVRTSAEIIAAFKAGRRV
jgi:nicotinamidase-related amidase